MKTLFVADPFSKLNAYGDTTLVFVRQALNLGHEAYWTTAEGIEFEGGMVFAKALRIESCAVDDHPYGTQIETFDLKNVDLVFIRKDPPFNAGYVRLCWILSLAEKQTVLLNKPSLLLRYHEKLVPLEAYSEGFLSQKDLIPTHVGTYESAKTFVSKLGAREIILKPFLGFGGRDITRVSAKDFITKASKHEDVIVQPFKSEVEDGDHRVFFLNGKLIGSFARIPPEGKFISNLAAGGTAKKVKLTKTQTALMEKVGKFLKAKGIFFAGADLIGNLVSEVNITSPTGFRAFEKLYGEDLSVPLFKEAMKCLKK